MSDFNRIMAKEIAKAKCGCKFIKGNIFNISPDIEWLKWLSYESEFEKKRMVYFDSKKISELSYEELEEVSKYSKNKLFAKLFKVYGTSECSKEDYMRVYDYMCNESIEKLMLDKLTSEELQYAKEEIIRLSKISKQELTEKIKMEKENYETLSMVDSYILHMICNVDYARSFNDLNDKIDAQIEQNNVMRQKSLYYASKTFI